MKSQPMTLVHLASSSNDRKLFEGAWTGSTRFSAILLFWALSAQVALAYTLVIVARLDVSFFEANGMIADAGLREAFYFQIFETDPVNLVLLGLSLVGVSVVSYLFAKSQVNYFKRIDQMLHQFAKDGSIQDTDNMGGFSPYLALWMQIMQRRYKGESLKNLKNEVEQVTRIWPKAPKVSWMDQIQFGVGAGALAGIFAMFSLSSFMKVNDGVVNLSNRLVRFKTASGPAFLSEQVSIVNFVGITLLSFMCLAFVWTGYRYGKLISESSYSILRDLRRFMEGSSDQRFFLRKNDLGREYIPSMNDAMDKIAQRLKD